MADCPISSAGVKGVKSASGRSVRTAGRFVGALCYHNPALPQPKPKRDTEDALHTLLSLRINLAPSEPGMTKFPSERYKQRTTLIGTLHHLHHENAISWSARPTSNSSRELQITSEAPKATQRYMFRKTEHSWGPTAAGSWLLHILWNNLS
jgi:hypothetical protein